MGKGSKMLKTLESSRCFMVLDPASRMFEPSLGLEDLSVLERGRCTEIA